MSAAGLLSLLLVVVVFALSCWGLERRGRGDVVLLLVLGVVVADVVLYPDTEAASLVSLFHPEVVGQSLRLTQVVIPVALLARLLVRGLPLRLADPLMVLWMAFFAWVLFSVVAGVVVGNPVGVVLGEGAMVVHVGGALVLAATVPAQDLLTGPALPRFLRLAAALATLLFVLDTAGVRITSTSGNVLPLLGFGQYGADAATVFGTLGVLGLLTELARPRPLPRRAAVLVPSALLLLSHLAVPQRAARLGLYLTVLLVLAVLATPRARRRVWSARREVAVGLLALVAALSSAVLVSGLRTALPPEPPRLVSAMDTGDQVGALGIQTRQGSIDSRFYQWEVAGERIVERPVFGHGLGSTIVYYEVGDRAFVRSNITHNIGLDLLLRTGLAGLLLFTVAVVATLSGAVTVWRRAVPDMLAALALAGGAALVGLLARGGVESIFDKYRLAVLLGVLVGILVSARRSLDEVPGDPARVARSASRSVSV